MLPSALRGTSGGASMTTPGGAGTPLRARRTGFYHRVGAPTTPRAGFRPFVANRNICNFMWYGGVERGVAGVGLRSVGEEALPSSKSVCSILPIVRHLRAGVSRAFHPPFALPRAYGTPDFPLPFLAGEPVRGRR